MEEDGVKKYAYTKQGKHKRLEESSRQRLHDTDPNAERPPDVRLATQLHLADVFNPVSKEFASKIKSGEITASSIDQEFGKPPKPEEQPYLNVNEANYVKALMRVNGISFNEAFEKYKTIAQQIINEGNNPGISEERIDQIMDLRDQANIIAGYLDACIGFGIYPEQELRFGASYEFLKHKLGDLYRIRIREIKKLSDPELRQQELEAIKQSTMENIEKLKLSAIAGENSMSQVRDLVETDKITLLVRQILNLEIDNGSKRTLIPTIEEGTIEKYVTIPTETAIFPFIQTPVGEYGSELAKKIMRTTYRMVEAARKLTPQFDEAYENDTPIIEVETARGRDKKQYHTKPNPVLTAMQEGIMSLGVTIALMTIERDPQKSADELVQEICERQLPNILAIHIPMGWINPFSLVGKYPKNFLIDHPNGETNSKMINLNILRETRKVRDQMGKTAQDMTGFGCPIGIREAGSTESGLEALTTAFYKLYEEDTLNNGIG